MSILLKTSCIKIRSNHLSVLRNNKPSLFNLCFYCKSIHNFRTDLRLFFTLNVREKSVNRRHVVNSRFLSVKIDDLKKKRTTLNYVLATGLICGAMTYAAVPLYRIFCSAYSYGGTVSVAESGDKIESMKTVPSREIAIHFNADVSSNMRWNFKPQQTEIIIRPGETALAFYTARNPTNVPIIGVSSYNVLPFDAGKYFVKIQCFCFEEQQLNPHEQVDMPVFFYIDPEFAEDPKMELVDEITLSYTFFEAKESSGLLNTIASYAKPHKAS